MGSGGEGRLRTRAWIAACALMVACNSEKFSGSEATAVDASSDGASNDGNAASNDGSGGDAAPSGVHIQCAGTLCDRVCCYSEDGTSATCQATSEPCLAPKRRFLCDNGADCAAQGLAGFQCCATDMSGLTSAQCEKACSNMEWRLCDPVNGSTECLGDTVQGENCRQLADRSPAGFSACQK